MAVYVDELFKWESANSQAFFVGQRHGHQWCHMWADTTEELHVMAKRIGLRREWFQDKPGFPHYDLTPPRRQEALMCGAEFMPARVRTWARILLS